MKKSTLTAVGLMVLTALVVVVGVPSLLSAGGPAPQTSATKASPDVGAMFKEIKKDLAVIRAELAEIKSMIGGKASSALTPAEKAALQLAKDFTEVSCVKPNLEKAMGLIDTPFLYPMDNNIITDLDQLRKSLKEDLDAGAKSPFKMEDFNFEIETSPKLTLKNQQLVDKVAPKDRILVKVTVDAPPENSVMCYIIRTGEKPKLVGMLYLKLG